MGVILRQIGSGRMTTGIVNNRFMEFESDDQEQLMMEDGVYSSQNKADILTM